MCHEHEGIRLEGVPVGHEDDLHGLGLPDAPRPARGLTHRVDAVIRFVPTNRWELHKVEARLYQPRMADEHVDAVLDPLRHPRLAALGRNDVGLHHRDTEAMAAEEVLHAPGDVAGAGVRRVDEHPATRQPLGELRAYGVTGSAHTPPGHDHIRRDRRGDAEPVLAGDVHRRLRLRDRR